MRTTVSIDDALMLALKNEEAREGKPFKTVLNETLARGLGLGKEGQAATPWRCPAHDLGAAKVDLDKALRLADLLEADAVAEKWELGK